jgi:hypothetical protein
MKRISPAFLLGSLMVMALMVGLPFFNFCSKAEARVAAVLSGVALLVAVLSEAAALAGAASAPAATGR